jgi:hypothetical protein
MGLASQETANVVLLKSMTAMLASLAGLLLASPVSPPGTGGAVSQAEWRAMLARHRNGGVIELGQRRVDFVRAPFQPRAQVTIRGGVFGPIQLDQWRNVVFDGSRFAGPPGTPVYQALIAANEVQGLVIRNCRFTGYRGDDGVLAVRGPLIRGGRDVTIERSTFEDMTGNIALIRARDVRFRDNEIRRIREGVQIVGGGNIVIERNRFEEFIPGPGDHPDGIQLFMNNLKPDEPGVQDLIIRDNLFLAAGKAQAIFVTGGKERLGTGLGYERFTIEGNVIVGAAWHGITAPFVSGLTVRGNHLFRIADSDKFDSRLTAGGQDVVVQDNEANAFILADGVRETGNRRIGPSKAARIEALVAQWMAKYRPQ